MSFQKLQQALGSRRFEIIERDESSPRQLRLVGRVPEDAPIADNWLLAIRQLLLTRGPWSVDASKKYSVRQHDGVLVYYWRLIFQAQDDQIAQHYDKIAQGLLAAPRSNRVEVTRMPLSGNRTYMGRHGARVGPAGKVLTGPDLLRRGR